MSSSLRIGQACRSFLVTAEAHDVGRIYQRISRDINVHNVFFWPESSKCLFETSDASKMTKVLRGIPPVLQLNRYRYPIFDSKNMDWTIKPPFKTTQNEIPLVVERKISCDELDNVLRECSSLSSQISTLYQHKCMSEGDIRLRYLFVTCLGSILPNSNINVFGSLISELGGSQSDLDVTIDQFDLKRIFNYTNANFIPYSKIFRYVGKKLQTFDKSISNFCFHRGAIPIIVFHHDVLGFDVDISYKNDTGREMAELLQVLTIYFPELKPLSFVLKHILKTSNVLLPQHTPVFNSFKFLALLLHFLQVSHYIPSFDSIRGLSEKSAILQLKSLNSPKELVSLEDILLDFLDYLSALDPSQSTICLSTGCLLPKNSRTFLDCPNPLNPKTNITKNILLKNWKLAIAKLNVAAINLKQNLSSNSSHNWGLLTLSESVNVGEYEQMKNSLK